MSRLILDKLTLFLIQQRVIKVQFILFKALFEFTAHFFDHNVINNVTLHGSRFSPMIWINRTPFLSSVKFKL